MNKKQKIITVNSYMLTKLQYSMPPIIGEKESTKAIVQRSIVTLARLCKGLYCGRISVQNICKSFGWDNPGQTIYKQGTVPMKKTLLNHSKGKFKMAR